MDQIKGDFMNWISIDPAKGISGVAFWDGDQLLHTKIVKARGNKGAFYVGESVVPSRQDAWEHVVAGQSVVIIEKGMGHRPNVVSAQGWCLGYIESICDRHHTPCHIVNVSEWRRVIKEAFAVSWARNSEKCKALAMQVVRKEYELDVTADEADAVLLGHASKRMGLANV